MYTYILFNSEIVHVALYIILNNWFEREKKYKLKKIFWIVVHMYLDNCTLNLYVCVCVSATWNSDCKSQCVLVLPDREEIPQVLHSVEKYIHILILLISCIHSYPTFFSLFNILDVIFCCEVLILFLWNSYNVNQARSYNRQDSEREKNVLYLLSCCTLN